MAPFPYQITVQWSSRHEKYEAFSPTLMEYSNRFLPKFRSVAYEDTPEGAISSFINNSKKLISELRKLCILPPPSDFFENDMDEEEILHNLA